jgi:hypothetical protein
MMNGKSYQDRQKILEEDLMVQFGLLEQLQQREAIQFINGMKNLRHGQKAMVELNILMLVQMESHI